MAIKTEYKKARIVKTEEPKVLENRRSCCSPIALIKSIWNIIVCIGLLLLVGAITKSSVLSILISFGYCEFYPGFVREFIVAAFDMKWETIKNTLFSQNHFWNLMVCILYFILYIISNGFIELLFNKVIEEHLHNKK